MSSFTDYTNDYINKKKKKKLEEEKEQSFTSYTSDYMEKKASSLKAKESKEDDIAPVKDTWLKKGALEDGFSFKNFEKALRASKVDVATNIAGGVLEMGEKALDWLAGVAPYYAQGQFNMNGGDFMPLEMQKRYQESVEAQKEFSAGFISKDLYDGHEVAKKIISNPYDKITGTNTEEDSVLGTKMQSTVQSGGQMLATKGLSKLFVPWQVVTGITAWGGEAEAALQQGATLDEAMFSGLVSAGGEVATELLSGGINFGSGTVDDMLTKRFGQWISNKTLRTLVKFGVDVAGEGGEEVLSEAISAVGKKLSYLSDEEMKEILTKEDARDAFIGGAIMGGVSSGFNIAKSGVQGVDSTTEFTKNEQAVVDKLYKDRLSEAERSGKKLTVAEKNEIYDGILESMDKGLISIDTIEEALGGEEYSALKSLQREADEYKSLYDTETGRLSQRQIDRLNELKAKNDAKPYEDALKEAKGKLTQNVSEMVKGDRLFESYMEDARRGQDFVPDFDKFKGAKHADAARKTIESAMKVQFTNPKDGTKRGMNNTRGVRDFVDFLAQVSGDTGLVFDLNSDEQVKSAFIERKTEQIEAIESIPEEQRTPEQTAELESMRELLRQVESGETTVNGNIQRGTVVLNLDSDRALNVTVGHEVTHNLEKAKSYGDLRNALYSYAKTKGIDVEAEKAKRKATYSGETDADIEAEFVADMVGEYLFTDQAFINHLAADNRNVFQKIWDDIKHLYKLATAGSKEARELERVKRAFEKAYREAAEFTPEAREFSDVDTKYSIRQEAPPKKTIEGYKVFMVKDGKLYPPMVANPEGEGTPMGVWLNADVGGLAYDSDGNVQLNTKGRFKVKAGGKGTQGGGGELAFRPGWHLGEYPDASQFGRENKDRLVPNKKGKMVHPKELFPYDFVWARCEVAADHDYQLDAMSFGVNENGKFERSQAGLPYIPEDGYYKYRTNANPDTAPWIISGAIKVVEILDDDQVARICAEHGVTPQQRQGFKANKKSGYSGEAKPGGKIDLSMFGLQAGEVTPTAAEVLEQIRQTEGTAAERKAATMELLKTLPGYAKRQINFDDANIIKEFGMNNQSVDEYRSMAEESGHGYLNDDKIYRDETKYSLSDSTGDVRYSLIGEKANLSEEDKANLQTAKEMKAQGKSNEGIYKATGWYTQSDGKWRTELPDEIMIPENFSRTGLQSVKDAEADAEMAEAEELFKDGSISEGTYKKLVKLAEMTRNDGLDSGKLPRFLHAPKLYEAYPELKETSLWFKKLSGMQGYTDSGRKQIVLDPDGLRDAGQTVREGLAHEIQHIIQNIEGFAAGSNPKDAGSYEAYRKAGGEIEARDVEDRLRMTDDERKANMPVQFSLSDSDGRQLTKEQAEYFKRSKMRDADGKLKPMYHGTQNGGFHTFDSDYSDDGASFFFTDSNAVAASYSGTHETYAARSFRTAEDFNRFFKEIGANEYSVKEEMHGSNRWFQLYEDGDEVASAETANMLYEEFRDWSGLGYGYVNYKVYLNLENPLVVDAEGNLWDQLPGVNDKTAYEYIKVLDVPRTLTGREIMEGISNVTIEYAMTGDSAPVTETVGNLYQKFPEGLADKISNMAPGEILKGAYANPSTTRDYSLYAKENGYDGVIFKNIVDVGVYASSYRKATVAIAFDSNQIKSVANQHPTSDPDIRYSMSKAETDKTYLDAVNRGDTATAQMMVDEVAKDSGFDYRGVHMTGSEFTVFDRDRIGSGGGTQLGDGFYVSLEIKDEETAKYAESAYGKRKMDLYVKMQSPLELGKPISEETVAKLSEDLMWFGDDDSVRYGVAPEVVQRQLTSGDSYEQMEAIRWLSKENGISVSELLKMCGYDGIISANEYVTQAVVWDENQLKSADPVTYDNSGNVIPLSERFNAGDPDIRYSLSEGSVATDGLDDFSKGYLDTKSIRYSISAVDSHKQNLEKKYSTDSSVEYATIMKRYDKILGIWKRIGGELDSKFLNDWNNKVERPFTVFKAQSGYKYNMELSSMCKKGVPLFEAIDTIVKKEVMKELKTDVLGKEEKEILYDILKQHNFEIPCAICYVEQARQREGIIIDAFLNGKTETNANGEVIEMKLGWNQVLDAIQNEMSANGVNHNFAFVSRDIATDKYMPADLQMDEQTYAAFAEAVKKIANEEIVRYNQANGKNRPLLKGVTPEAVKKAFGGTLPSNLKIFKVLLTEPSSRFKIQNDLLYSSMTTKNLTMAHNGLYGLFNSQGGVSGYKTKQAPTVYWGELLGKKWTPGDTRKEGGIRNQSNSDFQMYTLIDQAQMYIDCTAKGYYLQAYTKVLSELKLFGLSRGKINASLIPQVKVYRNADGTVDVERTMANAGLDENGNPAFDDVEGIDHNEAFMLIGDPEYSKNICGICIGYSDNHIRKLLDDSRVQLIIGFHDKTNDPDKRYRGARYAKNYNGLNEAVNLKDGKTVHIGFNPFVQKAEKMFTLNKDTETFEGEISYNGKTYTADDIPRLAADLYLESCAKKGYDPAYKDFSGHRNYYKLLADFGLYDSQGHYAPHRKVAYDMPDQIPYLDADGNKQYMSTEEYIKQELQKELAVRDAICEAMADTSEDGIIPQFIAEVKRREIAPSQSLSRADEVAPTGGYRVYGKDMMVEDVGPIAYNANPNASSALDNTENALGEDEPEETPVAPTEEPSTVAESATVAPEDDHPIKTVKQRLTAKLENRQTELANIEKLRADAIKAYDEKIAKAQATLDGKKNKDTKVANTLKKRIERLKRLKADIAATYEKRINDIKRGIDTTSEELEKDHTERDRYERAVHRINTALEAEKAELTAEYAAKKEQQQKLIADKSAFVSRMAKDLYEELSNLRKGVRASANLGSLLDGGYGWSSLKSALSYVRYQPDGVMNADSAAESAVRQLIDEAYEDEVYKVDDLDVELAEKIQELENRAEEDRHNAQRAAQRAKVEERLTGMWQRLIGNTSTWVDLPTGLSYKTKTLRRILRKVVKDATGQADIQKADQIYDELETKYDSNEAELKRESQRLKEVFAKLKLNHKEDIYAHMLGELRHNPASELSQSEVDAYYKANKGKIDPAKVDKAIEESRKLYEDLFVRVNEVLREHGMKELDYRQGYFPHFNNPKQNWLMKAFNWKPVNNEIPTSIAGLTQDFKPSKSYQSFDKQREGDPTDYSLYQGLDMYIHGALDWIYHIEDIQSRRALENLIRFTHSDEGAKAEIKRLKADDSLGAEEFQEQVDLVLDRARTPLGGFVREMRNRTNTLANKKSSLDREMEDFVNRKVYSTMTNLNNRVTANMVVGSISSALTNFIPITQSWVQVSPLYTVRGLGDFVRSAVKDDGMVAKSDFLTNRLIEEEALYKTGWDKVTDKAAVMMNVIDNITSQTVWRSKYLQNIHEGMIEAEAIKDADQFAKNLMAGRSRGNAPSIFDSKNPLIKIFTAFQLEVANQYGFMFNDSVKDSKNKARLVKGYATAFMGAYLYNALYSSLVGRDAAFDPIGIIEDLLRGLFGDDDEEEEVADTLLDFGVDVAQEAPFIGGFLGGGRVPLSSAIPYSNDSTPIESFMGDIGTAWNEGKPLEGNWKPLTKELLKPLYYLAMPVGGGQFKKTVEGLSMFSDDHPVAGSYTDSGSLRYPVEDTIGNRVQAGLFGQYSSDIARDYFDNGRSPLKEKQIQEFIDVEMPIRDYWDYREELKEQETLEEKFDYIAGLDLPVEKKNILINNIVDRKDDVDMSDYDDFSSYEEFDWYTKNEEKYNFLQDNGVSYQQYKSSDKTKEKYDAVYSWYKNNPEKVTVSRAVTDNVIEYREYTSALNDIRADKDSSGKTIVGSAKEKKIEYINSLDLDYGARLILFRSEYNADDTYNNEIIEYINGRDDLTYGERVTILRELGFTVTADGHIYWD